MPRSPFLVNIGNAVDVSKALDDAYECGRMESLQIPRLPWHSFFMLHAHLAATRSTCDRGPELLFDKSRHGVGAVLVRDHRVIAGGYNGSPPGQPHCSRVGKAGTAMEDDAGHLIRDGHCIRTVHAERNALNQCALDGVSSKGAILYVTASPCYDCAKDVIRAEIAQVFCAESYESRYGLSAGVKELLESAGIELGMLPNGRLGIFQSSR